jgi:hypothetical protein
MHALAPKTIHPERITVMQMNTVVSIGFRNVGDSSSEPSILEDAPISDAIRWLIQKIGDHSLAKRFDIIIGKDPEYIRQKLNESRNARKVAIEDFDADVMALMNRMPSDDPEDTWTPPTTV